jgi:hypothetical protein
MLHVTSTRPRPQCGEEHHNLPRLAIQNLRAVGGWQCFHLTQRRLRHREDSEAHSLTFILGAQRWQAIEKTTSPWPIWRF